MEVLLCNNKQHVQLVKSTILYVKAFLRLVAQNSASRELVSADSYNMTTGK